METRSVEANPGITPTIAHVPTGIVHGQPLTKGRFEKVPGPLSVDALGETLLVDALRRTLGLSASLGIHAVEVAAIDEQASAFCEKYGFVSLPEQKMRLDLPLAIIRQVF
jgi:hypothetical protein